MLVDRIETLEGLDDSPGSRKRDGKRSLRRCGGPEAACIARSCRSGCLMRSLMLLQAWRVRRRVWLEAVGLDHRQRIVTSDSSVRVFMRKRAGVGRKASYVSMVAIRRRTLLCFVQFNQE